MKLLDINTTIEIREVRDEDTYILDVELVSKRPFRYKGKDVRKMYLKQIGDKNEIDYIKLNLDIVADQFMIDLPNAGLFGFEKINYISNEVIRDTLLDDIKKLINRYKETI